MPVALQALMVVLILFLPAHSMAIDGQMSGYRLTVGLKLSSNDFDVYPEGGLTPIGTLSEDFTTLPFVSLSGPYSFFGNSNWGWLMEYSLSQFRLRQQEVNDRLVDLGTSVEGFDVYITPTLFYSFNGQWGPQRFEDLMTIGVGVGVGYLDASGDIILTKTTQQRLPIDIGNTGLAASVFFDYQVKSFRTRISGGGTGYTDGGLDYESFRFDWSFGYSF